tara:strand:- start:3364 stop:3744 length:381 start_codon:yes stop_codon:yes gene_type:complete
MTKKNILIVEDDKDLRESWEMFFNNFGVDVHTVTNGMEAKEIINQYPLEIILTDIQMPLKDGYFVLEYAKSQRIDTKVWACSGQLFTKNVPENKYHFDKILTKPFDMLNVVEEIISITSENNANKT